MYNISTGFREKESQALSSILRSVWRPFPCFFSDETTSPRKKVARNIDDKPTQRIFRV